nr:sensor histidine kinase [Microbacterium bovistercoris]
MTKAGEPEVRILEDADLRLPRPPGVIRRFWARHPLFTDILIALACLLLAIPGATNARRVDSAGAGAEAPWWGISLVIVLLILATSAALLVRRRVPLLPFALATALQLTTIAAPHGAAVPALVVATYALAVYGSNRVCVIAALACTALVTLATAAALAVTDPALALMSALNTFFNTGFSVLVGALVGVNIGNRRRWIAAVLDRSRQLVIERDQQAELAAAAERERIAREMHDIVSHSLTVIVALTEGAGATADRDRARDATDAAAATARQALNEMRTMLGVLRTDGVASPLAPPAPVPLQESVAAAQRAGFPVSLTTTGADDVAAPIAYAVGRIVQEGVTNAIRHAPNASTIAVRVDYATDGVTVQIDNDGVRPASTPPGFGLRGLAERAALLGGELRSEGRDGTWRLRARIPIPHPVQGDA